MSTVSASTFFRGDPSGRLYKLYTGGGGGVKSSLYSTLYSTNDREKRAGHTEALTHGQPIRTWGLGGVPSKKLRAHIAAAKRKRPLWGIKHNEKLKKYTQKHRHRKTQDTAIDKKASCRHTCTQHHTDNTARHRER